MKERNVVVKQSCHSRGMLSGISLIRIFNKQLGLLFKQKTGQVEDPRQKSSGMTSSWITPHGFTLIELLVVVLIIGILAAIALPQYQLAVKKTRISTFLPLLNTIKTAQEIHFLREGEYVADLRKLEISIPNTCYVNDASGMRWTCGTDIFLDHGETYSKPSGYIAIFYCPGYNQNSSSCLSKRHLGIYFYYNHPLKTTDIPKARQKNCEVKNNSALGKKLCHALENSFNNVYD